MINNVAPAVLPYPVCRPEIPGFELLAELALNLRWAWNHATDEVWIRLDEATWKHTNNPWLVLQTVPRIHLKAALDDDQFHKRVLELLHESRNALLRPGWFTNTYPGSELTSVAYFSMEYMLSEALPIYSGGLGNVAGDQLKAASDLGVPMTAVGLLYQKGYFRQVLDREGNQQALYPYNDPSQLPILPMRSLSGDWLRIAIQLGGRSIWLRVWQVLIGSVRLYLLDSNDPANLPAHRGVTSELYGGSPELRLQQEIVLGIGGWRALDAIGVNPEVCHLNEGHAALAILERARCFMVNNQCSFDVALTATRAGNIFTTHTAVPAGFDRFPPELTEQYLAFMAHEELHIPVDQLLGLGRRNPNDRSEEFNMAYLAVHGSGSVNGVSRLHGAVSRRIFAPLFWRWPEAEIPVGHITNGVHMPTWDSAGADRLWTDRCGKERWMGETGALQREMGVTTDDSIWTLRSEGRKALVEFVRERVAQQMIGSGSSQVEIESAKQIFDPGVLTLGFARRFATYKRPDLLLRDRDRLLRLLTSPDRPVQLVVAGKAHPADEPGKRLIHEWIQFIRNTAARSHVVFLHDYDMHLAQRLVEGVDVWINTPRRPWEASGTSGMKVLVNGGLNISELDGWWAEAYRPEVGWAIGDGRDRGDDPAWDDIEAKALYDALEYEVIPQFYAAGQDGIPAEWINKIRLSMATLTPEYSATRTVCQYVKESYLAAAGAYRKRLASGCELAVAIVNWRRHLDREWHNVQIGPVCVTAREEYNTFQTVIALGKLPPEWVQVELFADGSGGEYERHEMSLSP
ncbi:MAG: alpha-glucan family phosphorylase, partial [Bryobacteraceae bacterium]|nr:alpha-glucan family phosphorylase [Bryobacteraceae bacterium]